jgi:hypothetical protein
MTVTGSISRNRLLGSLKEAACSPGKRPTLRHPRSRELAELREAVLARLMEQRQSWDPFGFQVYAELAGAELSPLRATT